MQFNGSFGNLWVRFVFSAQMAWHGVLANPLRSALTVLGVAIGVASVVTLMGIGEGARQAVVRQFESLGTNVIVIKAEDPSVEFDPQEIPELVERVQGLQMATPVVRAESPVRWRRTTGTVGVLGVNEHFPEVRDHPLAAGHFFTGLHVLQRSPVAVLGYDLAAGLMDGRSPVGQTVTLGGSSYRIVGVLSPKDAGNGEDIGQKILIPYTSAQKIAEKRTVEEIWGKAATPDEADLATVQLGRIFSRKLGLDQSAPTPVPGGSSDMGGDAPMREMVTMEKMGMAQAGGGGLPGLSTGKDMITITSLNQLVKEADKANRVMSLLLGGIAAVSLLVGGLGIMNIMLVAVTERTGEIGVRRALGAKQGDLLTQFLIEALYLSGIGAIFGVLTGVWGVSMFSQYGFETVVSFQAIQIASFVALMAGLLFGIYPAMSASSVPPVEALRR